MFVQFIYISFIFSAVFLFCFLSMYQRHNFPHSYASILFCRWQNHQHVTCSLLKKAYFKIWQFAVMVPLGDIKLLKPTLGPCWCSGDVCWYTVCFDTLQQAQFCFTFGGQKLNYVTPAWKHVYRPTMFYITNYLMLVLSLFFFISSWLFILLMFCTSLLFVSHWWPVFTHIF